jgi:hypothetical protein
MLMPACLPVQQIRIQAVKHASHVQILSFGMERLVFNYVQEEDFGTLLWGHVNARSHKFGLDLYVLLAQQVNFIILL